MCNCYDKNTTTHRHTSLTMTSGKPGQAVTRIIVDTINAGTTIAALVTNALINICQQKMNQRNMKFALVKANRCLYNYRYPYHHHYQCYYYYFYYDHDEEDFIRHRLVLSHGHQQQRQHPLATCQSFGVLPSSQGGYFLRHLYTQVTISALFLWQ